MRQHPSTALRRCALVSLLGGLLVACAGPTPLAPPLSSPTPVGWHTPLPHDGDAQVLKTWWARFDDPLLPELVQAADRSNPTLAQALARVAQARANARIAGARLAPSLDGSTSLARTRNELPPPALLGTQLNVGLDARWEWDLFGANRQALAAAERRAEASSLQWHDARVSLAAEVANSYLALRACEALVAVYQQSATSQGATADLTREKVRVGFESPANGALADASQAEAANRLTAQRAECDVALQGLVLLTGIDAASLQARLQPATGRLPLAAPFAVDALPARVLAQRPDVAAAARTLQAAAADIGSAEAARYPTISLGGSITLVAGRAAGVSATGVNWSFGPSLSLPLFDQGRIEGGVDAARGRYDEARAGFELQARQAVREVEEALLRLAAARSRVGDAERAALGYRSYFDAAQTRWRVGAGSLIEMEDARRFSLNAEAALVSVQRERVAAWVALYKAAGGGWEGPAPAEPTPAHSTATAAVPPAAVSR
jgi:NodT family efflux transporter outer membrane factor (OMF) lipoprotein